MESIRADNGQATGTQPSSTQESDDGADRADGRLRRSPPGSLGWETEEDEVELAVATDEVIILAMLHSLDALALPSGSSDDGADEEPRWSPLGSSGQETEEDDRTTSSVHSLVESAVATAKIIILAMLNSQNTLAPWSRSPGCKAIWRGRPLRFFYMSSLAGLPLRSCLDH